MKKPTSQPTKVLVHPNHPEVKALCRKPTRAERNAVARLATQYQRVMEVTKSDGTPVLEKSGEPKLFVQQLVPAELNEASVALVVVRVDGVTDEHDEPIEITGGESPKNLSELSEDYLSVTEKVTVDGKVVDSVTTFERWIAREIAKPDAFDSDPTTAGSPQP